MRKTGAITQRDLVPILKELVDAASAPNSTAHRDIARARLREVLATCNWRTSYIYVNVGPRRLRYLASIGHHAPSKWLFTGWRTNRPGVDKGNPDE